MSDRISDTAFDGSGDDLGPRRTPGPFLPLFSLVASIAGALIGYFANWPVGVMLVLAGIVAGVLAHRRRAPHRWAATLGIAISALCLIVCFAVIGIVVYQAQQMSSLLS